MSGYALARRIRETAWWRRALLVALPDGIHAKAAFAVRRQVSIIYPTTPAGARVLEPAPQMIGGTTGRRT
jgi:hypothetical protein